jgi:hypothetical protein
VVCAVPSSPRVFPLYARRVPTYQQVIREEILVGRRQVVRQRILIPSCGGSNPPAPAIPLRRSRKVAVWPMIFAWPFKIASLGPVTRSEEGSFRHFGPRQGGAEKRGRANAAKVRNSRAQAGGIARGETPTRGG